mgnify:CR=1 FL=1
MAGSKTKWRSGLNWEFCPKVGQIFPKSCRLNPEYSKQGLQPHEKSREKRIGVA